jgi:ribonuclease P protein component
VRRADRLRVSADFQRLRASGRSWAHPLLILYLDDNQLRAPRVGVSVSRRVGKAVVRNRVRRRVREAVRGRWAQLAPGRDLLFIARPAIAEASWPDVRGAVDSLLRRGRAFRPRPAEAAP